MNFVQSDVFFQMSHIEKSINQTFDCDLLTNFKALLLGKCRNETKGNVYWGVPNL